METRLTTPSCPYRQLSARQPFVRATLEEYAESGRPLWPPIPSSLYAAFLAGYIAHIRVVAISRDSSVRGWGARVSSAAHPDGRSSSAPSRTRKTCSTRYAGRRSAAFLPSRLLRGSSTCPTPGSSCETTVSPHARPSGKGTLRLRSSSSVPCASLSSSGTLGATRCSSTPPALNWSWGHR
jgi:hypothetical protein